MKTAITALFLIFTSLAFAAGSIPDPNFPSGNTYGKNLVAADGTASGDRQFSANFFTVSPPFGAKFKSFTLLNPNQCVEASGSYYKYSATCDKCASSIQYMLVPSTGGLPPLGTAANPNHEAIAVGKPATNNAVAFLAGNNPNDCHSTASQKIITLLGAQNIVNLTTMVLTTSLINVAETIIGFNVSSVPAPSYGDYINAGVQLGNANSNAFTGTFTASLYDKNNTVTASVTGPLSLWADPVKLTGDAGVAAANVDNSPSLISWNLDEASFSTGKLVVTLNGDIGLVNAHCKLVRFEQRFQFATIGVLKGSTQYGVGDLCINGAGNASFTIPITVSGT